MDQLRSQLTVLRWTVTVLSAVAVASCGRSAESRPVVPPTQAVVADTASIATLLTRFRLGLSPVSELEGSRTRDALVRAWVEGMATGNADALDSLTLNRSEFAYLYYPDSPQSKPPYELEPDLMWMQIRSHSQRGLSRALANYGKGDLHFLRYQCVSAPEIAGPIALYNQCTVTHLDAGKEVTEPLFGSILRRGGRFKFVGLSNRL
jgi:hypothetical protein